MDHIRADLFLGMIDGTYTGLDDAAIIALLTTAPAPDADQSHSHNGIGRDGDNNDRSEPDDNEPPRPGLPRKQDSEPRRPHLATDLENLGTVRPSASQ